ATRERADPLRLALRRAVHRQRIRRMTSRQRCFVATYFVYRCSYLRPMNVLVRRYEDATVLDWFRRVWPRGRFFLPRAWHDHVVKILGVSKGEDAICFVTMFAEIAEESRPAPESIEDVAAALDMTYHLGLTFEEHCVQLLNDDDEIDMTSYFFDDEF